MFSNETVNVRNRLTFSMSLICSELHLNIRKTAGNLADFCQNSQPCIIRLVVCKKKTMTPFIVDKPVAVYCENHMS